MLHFVSDGDEMLRMWNRGDETPGLDLSLLCDRETLPVGQMAPFDYGLIFMDYVKKQFWYMQEYTAISGMSPSLIKHYSAKYGDDFRDQVAQRIVSFDEYIGADKWKETGVSFRNGDDLNQHLSENQFKEGALYCLGFNGWDARRFASTPKGAAAFLHAILSDTDVILTGDEIETWNNYIYREDT